MALSLAHRAFKALIRWISKIFLYVVFFCISAKQIAASRFISYETSSRFSEWLYGYSSQENFDDLWFYTDVSLSILSASVLYVLTMKLIMKIRKK
jgi:hypothetical protein